MIKTFLRLLKGDVWDYGTCNKQRARKHIIKGNVQFVLWKSGQQGHKKDFWYDFYSDWWPGFVKD